MSPSPIAGNPCLIPVVAETSGGASARGFITRLGPEGAFLNSDPTLARGAHVTLQFKRPADQHPLVVAGQVVEAGRDGALWRGRPAVVVRFSTPLSIDELVANSGARIPAVGPPIAVEAVRPSAGLADALSKGGLGKRRRTEGAGEAGAELGAQSNLPPPPGPSPAPPKLDENAGGASPREVEPRGASSPISADGVPTAAAPAVSPGAPAPFGRTISASWEPGQDLSGQDPFEVPESSPTSPFPAAGGLADAPDLEEVEPVPELSGFDIPFADAQDDDFFGRFARVSDSAEAPALLPDDAFDEAPPARTLALHQDAPARSRGVADTAGESHADAPPVHNTHSLGHSRQLAPWELEARPSILPKEVRVASSLPVQFWARGKSFPAIAQNFSAEGLFLAFAGSAPMRGAIIRVEFPIEGVGEKVPVRFNAEVRWHRSDRPGSGMPDGFGVQILTFETPKDRQRYEALLAIVLGAEAHPPAAEPAFGRKRL